MTPSPYKATLIAFAGYAGAGKDEAARPLIDAGYRRVCFGDIIKRQLDALTREHLGVSAFTDDRAQKAIIRPTLEAWGDSNYDRILDEFFSDLEPPAVNTRLVRVREAFRWIDRGGIILEVVRPGFPPATNWEAARLEELRPFFTGRIINAGTADDLHRSVARMVLPCE